MTEAMVVDTNVLEHVFDPIMNGDGHVERLLRKFTEQRRKLCVDTPTTNQKSTIIAEYEHRLQSRWKTMDEQGQIIQWLRYIVIYAERVGTAVDLADRLGKLIVPQMNRVGAERSDQRFVYVACALNSVMISNNARHVTNLRTGLRKAARKIHCTDTDFLTSQEAEAGM
jgi:hypothetical protein